MRVELDRPELLIAKFPRNASCAVTTSWDDNESRNLKILEILNSMGLKGTFYIAPDKPRDIGLTDSELQTLAAANEIGSHTWSHVNLRRCDVNALSTELKDSKEYIHRITQSPVLGFAYPWGEHSSIAEKLVRENGYLFARTVEEGTLKFPPQNPYAWGVSVQALPRPRLLSRKAHVYLRYVTGDWQELAIKLFNRALQRGSVWHLFGHAWEIFDRPHLKEDLQRILHKVAGRKDVWYATNGMLFLNEMARRSVQISDEQEDDRFVFKIRTRFPLPPDTHAAIPLRLVVPESWNNNFDMQVTVPDSGTFEKGGRPPRQMWVDILGEEACIEVRHE